MSLSIPQTDPKANYLAHRDEIDAAIARVLESGWYILGAEVTAFEQEFAAYIGAAESIAVANGTDAIHVALRACGIGQGDGVITVSHTAVATVSAIELAGATPVLVDVDPETCTIDPAKIREAIETYRNSQIRIRAIIPVHLYGHPADMPAIMEIARTEGLRVIEDCAQSHGAEIGGRKTGTWGDIAAFSFYPTKNLGALGDGGGIATTDPELASAARLVREYGWKERYISSIPGMNSRLDELHAAPLRVKLRHLDADNSRRRRIAAAYDAALAGTGLGLPAVRPDCTHVYHQYVIRTPRRDELRAHLRQLGIGTLVHYPAPVHLQPAYLDRVPVPGGMAVTERLAGEILSLPIYPELRADQVERVIEGITAWAAQAEVAGS